MARSYHQGKYTVQNPQKYVGNPHNVVYRSSYEKKAFLMIDHNPAILRWMSEELYIPYISPVDGKLHRYFVDLVVEYRAKSGEIKKAAIEIKPKTQTVMPKKPQRVTKQFVESVQEYNVNLAKWAAAQKWCAERNMEFVIWTEENLGIGPRSKK